MSEVTPLPIREAAKEVHKSPDWIREKLIETGRLRAFRWGGSERRPWLRVHLHELRKAIEDYRVYVPPKARTGRGQHAQPKVNQESLNPSALAMLRD